ncbi:DUF2716 domain-containing protein [Bacillus nakamurai]|uniref:DUF2716 domain-containing protein n=1 Tax=Bacillus nakamurai TaxID=1793963 RepID=A0A150F3I9_9BACI|nr:DUF2716 domain-containing protein [Bacillus nakamurai]KXZ13067.1 hypothetical protein AXI58_05135 [Bacillus nakamurai]MED1227911.1 DUF2716 domain-containing protein [Bacillus nakamurai]
MNWHCLSEEETGRLWCQFNRAVKWKPGSKFDQIKPPKPFQIFDVSRGFNGEEESISLLDDAEAKIVKAFQSCTLKQEFMYALDYQHECYMFNPHEPIDKDEFGEWLVPAIPNGDNCFFIHQDIQWGLLGDPRQQTITVFGAPLIRAIHRNAPILFQS